MKVSEKAEERATGNITVINPILKEKNKSVKADKETNYP